MRANQESNRRRSQRLLCNTPVVVQAAADEKQFFEEETHTLVVNAHGALLTLATQVRFGQMLLLKNRNSREEQPCRVVYIGPTVTGKTQVGVAFGRPAPGFWQIAPRPEDWKR